MAEAVPLEVGVMFFRGGVEEFMTKLGIDALYVDNEDSSLRGFTLGTKDWVDIPLEEYVESSVVTLTPRPK